MAEFSELGLSEPVLQSLREMGFEEPTPVQSHTIPHLMAGRDVIAQALTGTGKTAAFGIPLVERIEIDRASPQAVVLAPTRELAVQVAEQISQIGRHRGLHLVPIYGGQPYDRQLRALRRGVHAIVATPGRLMDHMRRGTADLSGVTLLVLDEADEMLNMGFLEDIEYVMSHLPTERVTALFSATMPDAITRLARSYMREPELIQLSRPRELTVAKVEQTFIQVPGNRKFDALCRVLDVERPDRALIFCGTKRMVDEVVDRVVARGYEAEGLHGDMNQVAREKVLRAFRDGRVEVLVATDVAARGLDVPNITHVLNFDIPPDPEYYVHRIGRTARSGQAGEAITFVTPWEMRQLKAIERVTGAHIRRAEVPTAAEAEARQIQALQERLLETLQAGQWGAYRAVVEELFDDHDPVDLAAAALSLAAGRLGRDGGDLGALAAQREAEQAAPPPSEPDRAGTRPRRDRGPASPERGPARGGRGKPSSLSGRRPKGPPAGRPRRPGGGSASRGPRR